MEVSSTANASNGFLSFGASLPPKWLPTARPSMKTESVVEIASAVAPKTCPSMRVHRTCKISAAARSEEHTSELQSQSNLVCRLLLEKKKQKKTSVSPQ